MSSAPETAPLTCKSLVEFWSTYAGQRAQLIEGVVYLMAPANPRHTTAVHRLTRLLLPMVAALEGGFTLRHEAPLVLPDLTDPEPDVAIVRGAEGDFEQRHPTAEEAVLIIEVSDTILSHDRRTKLPRYAAAGVPEVWIVNLVDRVVEVYHSPNVAQRAYAHHYDARPHEQLAATMTPAVALRLADILG